MSSSLLRNAVLSAVLAVSICALAACGPSYEGTYSDPTGAIAVNVKSGGQATITFMNQTAQCTYTVAGDKLTMNCKGDIGTINFTLRPDGTLAGPPDSLIPPLKKK